MSEINTQAAETATAKGSVNANWDAIRADYSDVHIGEPELKEPEVKDVAPEHKDNLDKPAAEQPEPKDEKSEDVNLEVEVKPEDKANEETPVIEFKPEDIKDVPQMYEDGTFQGLAKDLGFEIKSESFEDFQNTFKENFVPKADAEKLKQIGKEELYATLKPEVAAALEMRELGLPEELIVNPTKDIDEYLSLSDAEIIRKDLEVTDGWTDEKIDKELEILSEKPDLLKHQADKIRINLNLNKKARLAQQAELVQRFTQEKQAVAIRQKQEQDTQFTNSLNDVKDFLGIPLAKGTKEAILMKYNAGKYNDVFNKPLSKVQQALFYELGDKLIPHIHTKAREEGKKEIVKKQANIPSKDGESGQRVEIKNQLENNWSGIQEDFK